MKILECIPNFSEGRNQKKIQAIVKAITDVPGVALLGQESDRAHNRSVVTFAGDPEAVIEAAYQGCKKAAALIDLRKHKGEHPRMGATDVIPLVPIQGLSEEECLPFAEKLGKRIGEELQIPVYLYERSAKRLERKNLADIRKGEYEGIAKEIGKNSERDPDFGPKKMGTAGATAVGVRFPLVAFNVNLKTKDVELAKSIAKKIRFKDGGFPEVKALGFELQDHGMVQVSMNLTKYPVSGLHRVFEAIKKEAKQRGVEVAESEIIGLVPEMALIDSAKHFLQMRHFGEKQILEKVLEEQLKDGMTLKYFINSVASKSPVPGGGSVAALAGTLAAALCSMVANLTLASRKYLRFHRKMQNILKYVEPIRQILFKLIDEDSKAYLAVRDAYRSEQGQKIEKALQVAAEIPLKTAKTTLKLLGPIDLLLKHGNPHAHSDCLTAKYLVEAAVKSAIANVEINLKEMKNSQVVRKLKKDIRSILSVL